MTVQDCSPPHSQAVQRLLAQGKRALSQRNRSTRTALLLGLVVSFVLLVACGSVQRPDGGSGPLLQGNRVSPLSAFDQRGAKVTVGRGSGLTVVYFYPKDGTPGCTAEACAFRDVWRQYQAANIRVIGVSNDDDESHREFSQQEKLPFSLIADTDGRWAHAFGVESFAGFYSRVTFLVSADGVVLKTYRDVDPGLHAKEILRDAQQLQNGPDGHGTATHSIGVVAPSLDPLAPAPRLPAQALPSVHLQLQSTLPTLAPDGTHEFWLGATLTPPPGSHLYWKHSGEVGLPTKIEFSGPPGVQLSEVQYPGPERFTTQHGQVAYGYDGPVTIVTRARSDVPLEQAAFGVIGSWLSCDVRCVKEQGSATLSLSEGTIVRPGLVLEPILARLVKPGSDVGLSATYDPDNKLLHVRNSGTSVLDILELFPEHDLGPEDKAPERRSSNGGQATWRWRAQAQPGELTLYTKTAVQTAYYRVACKH